MTNNDDFDQQDFNPTEELPAKRSVGNNLAEAWRSRPLFKLVVLMTAVAAVVAASVSFFSGHNSQNSASRIANPPSISAPPGGPASPYMQQQTALANEGRENEAMKSGGSALPTPIGVATDISDLSNDKKKDPLNDLRAEVERLRQDNIQAQQQRQIERQQIQQQQAVQKVQQPEQFDDTLATAMQHQMAQLMDSWTPHGLKEVVVKLEDGKPGANAEGTKANNGTGPNGGLASNSTQQFKTLVPAGTVSYAQLLTEANSDVPGPILAQIVSGPFSGARAVGQFQIANGYNDYLVLQFTLVNFKGKDYPINAIALDPDTTLGGMATEVDQRYFTRVVLPAAAGFLQGFGQAIGQGSSTVTTNGTTTIVSSGSQGIHQGIYQGIGQAANTASQFFQDQANLTKPLVRVAAGTPMGFFFVASVLDQTVQEAAQNPNGTVGLQNASQPNGLGSNLGGVNPYANGAGYPGATVSGYGSPTQSNVPYPNYATSGYRSSPYSTFTTNPVGAGTTLYGH